MDLNSCFSAFRLSGSPRCANTRDPRIFTMTMVWRISGDFLDSKGISFLLVGFFGFHRLGYMAGWAGYRAGYRVLMMHRGGYRDGDGVRASQTKMVIFWDFEKSSIFDHRDTEKQRFQKYSQLRAGFLPSGCCTPVFAEESIVSHAGPVQGGEELFTRRSEAQ